MSLWVGLQINWLDDDGGELLYMGGVAEDNDGKGDDECGEDSIGSVIRKYEWISRNNKIVITRRMMMMMLLMDYYLQTSLNKIVSILELNSHQDKYH